MEVFLSRHKKCYCPPAEPVTIRTGKQYTCSGTCVEISLYRRKQRKYRDNLTNDKWNEDGQRQTHLYFVPSQTAEGTVCIKWPVRQSCRLEVWGWREREIDTWTYIQKKETSSHDLFIPICLWHNNYETIISKSMAPRAKVASVRNLQRCVLVLIEMSEGPHWKHLIPIGLDTVQIRSLFIESN